MMWGFKWFWYFRYTTTSLIYEPTLTCVCVLLPQRENEMKEKYVNFLGVFKNHEVDGIDGNKYEGLSKTCCRGRKKAFWHEMRVNFYTRMYYTHTYIVLDCEMCMDTFGLIVLAQFCIPGQFPNCHNVVVERFSFQLRPLLKFHLVDLHISVAPNVRFDILENLLTWLCCVLTNA